MNIKKWMSTAIACSVLALSACGGQSTDNQEATASNGTATEKVYRVATNAEFAPFESMDAENKINGFDIDLLNAMAKAGNFKVEYKHQPWDSIFPALTNGDADILLSAITITDERKQTMDFTDPYFEISQVILVQKGKSIKSVEDLKQAEKVGVVTGQTGDFAASKILGNDSPKIARFKSLPLVIKELENGGLDAVVSDSAVVGNYIKNNSDKGFTMVAVPDFEVEHYGMAVAKNNTELLNMLNDALKKVHENGEYDQISDQYFSK
ncbi:basic amino acid ABC transporter substrate-binding protein [Neisseria montereyensis]|uniref:Basic amino acid ABC transporter substrate-binding protein n=1 Tax=Neisseria montereyensis TaxID=2973938 RepID=A0ABT2FBC9_9NEIS|nr:basic amino acid ABC transporter substrate-binding protein [Neisseria montereyensis]MCS4533467.1 basic amino acid ABC transporter substrate-binding protein [Neisseria montereyensis]